MGMGCAECDCIVEHGVRVQWCSSDRCCCAHLPKKGEPVARPS